MALTFKKLNLTELEYGQTSATDGVGAIHHPPRVIIADETTESTDSVIMVDSLLASGATPSRTVTISNSNREIIGYRVTIKDITGLCSKAQAISIKREDEGEIEGYVIQTISSPYGSMTLQSDGTDMFIVPTRPSIVFSPPTFFNAELGSNGATEDREFLRLPTDPSVADTIKLFYNRSNAYPYIVCSGTGTATISRMCGSISQNQVDQATVTPNSGTFAVASTPIYFTENGTATPLLPLNNLNTSASMRFRVEGFGTSLMTPYVVEMNFLSGGLDGGQPVMSIWGQIFSSLYFEQD